MSKKEDLQKQVKMRKAAGIASMAVGIPNFIVAILMCFGGIAVTVILGIIAYRLITGDSGGDNPFEAVCIVLLIVLVIAGIIIAVIGTLLAFFFALAVGGQTLGGYYAFRGKNFGRAIVLTFLGSIVSFLFGIGLVISAVRTGKMEAVQIGTLVWGIYDLLAFFVSFVAGLTMIKTRKTFKKKGEEEKKEKGKKGKKKKGKDTSSSSKSSRKKKKRNDEEEESW